MFGKSLYIISLVLLSVSLSAAVMADTQYPIPITNNIERTSDTSLDRGIVLEHGRRH